MLIRLRHRTDTVATDQQTMYAHHTEYAMPASGMLLPTITMLVARSSLMCETLCIRPSKRRSPIWPGTCIRIRLCDCLVSTNSSMHQDDIFRGVTYQLWRLSDLKLLKTEYFDVGESRYAHISPEEPRLGPDGSIFVQTPVVGASASPG